MRYPTTSHEDALQRTGYVRVAGIDEAGRGAWAGPVFAGAVILPPRERLPDALLGCVRDSKQLTPAAREKAFAVIAQVAEYVGVGVASSAEIDQMGIAPATRLAWLRAIGDEGRPDFLLLDAFALRESPLPQRPIVHGDSESLSIAAASIVAKVARDKHMRELAGRESIYGFERNKGYGTPEHRRALVHHGPCPQHRHSFAPLRQLRLALSEPV